MMIGQILGLADGLIDKVISNASRRAEAKIKLAAMQQRGELGMIEKQLSAIIAEAQSADRWTSRARPSFLYVVYIVILAAIPMGILYAFNADTAVAITDGFKAWLHAIPEEVWTLFGVGYLGYTGARTFDKRSK